LNEPLVVKGFDIRGNDVEYREATDEEMVMYRSVLPEETLKSMLWEDGRLRVKCTTVQDATTVDILKPPSPPFRPLSKHAELGLMAAMLGALGDFEPPEPPKRPRRTGVPYGGGRREAPPRSRAPRGGGNGCGPKSPVPPERLPDRKEVQRSEDKFRDPVGKVGRNDPCPCRSGRKYKKCCLYKTVKTAWNRTTSQ
jgi:hypothetical protein